MASGIINLVLDSHFGFYSIPGPLQCTTLIFCTWQRTRDRKIRSLDNGYILKRTIVVVDDDDGLISSGERGCTCMHCPWARISQHSPSASCDSTKLDNESRA